MGPCKRKPRRSMTSLRSAAPTCRMPRRSGSARNSAVTPARSSMASLACPNPKIMLPATQPGSSIMPGKVNPVMCEMVIQVGAQVIGNDAVVTFSATYGAFELNTMLPVAAYNLLQSITLLASASRVFASRCIRGLEADREKCEGNIEQSLAMCTSLAPVIGYDKAAQIAKVAHDTGRTVRQVALETSGLDKTKIAELLDARSQTEPGQGMGMAAGG